MLGRKSNDDFSFTENEIDLRLVMHHITSQTRSRNSLYVVECLVILFLSGHCLQDQVLLKLWVSEGVINHPVYGGFKL